jgi:predicted O-methyltransferase YrrM
MSDAIVLPPPLTEYIRQVSLKESAVQRRLREETLARPDASMLTSPEQAQFLALLARILGARRCLEIGVFTGYTSLFIAQSLPPDGVLVACDIDAETAGTARRYWREGGVEQRIDLRIAPALDTLDALLREGHAGRFDFAYIDADKRGYLDYYERALALLRRGGVIAADNVLWSGEVATSGPHNPDLAAMLAFNERLRDDPRVSISLLPMRDGLTLALKL